jgi:hypothetical protein
MGDSGELLYRPSLNTLFQNMLSSNELKLLSDIKLVKIITSFRMENVILFSVQIIIKVDIEVRFICYQTLRDFFPKDLLCFLE